jgi:hypothetical protein
VGTHRCIIGDLLRGGNTLDRRSSGDLAKNRSFLEASYLGVGKVRGATTVNRLVKRIQ